MSSVSTFPFSTATATNNHKNDNNNLLLSTSILVKTQLYQCWLQVYGPLFWIVSAMICLYSSSSRGRTTATPRPVVRNYSYYRHQMNVVQLIQQDKVKQYDNEVDNDDKKNLIIDRVPPPQHKRHDQQQFDDPKLEILSPHPKKSLRRSLKLHMQSIKLSVYQVVRRSTTRFHKNKKHPSPHLPSIDYNNNDDDDEPSVIHPLDLGKTQSSSSTCCSSSTRSNITSCSKPRRKSFATYSTKNQLIFNPFRRKTAPEIVIHNFNVTSKKKKGKAI